MDDGVSVVRVLEGTGGTDTRVAPEVEEEEEVERAMEVRGQPTAPTAESRKVASWATGSFRAEEEGDGDDDDDDDDDDDLVCDTAVRLKMVSETPAMAMDVMSEPLMTRTTFTFALCVM